VLAGNGPEVPEKTSHDAPQGRTSLELTNSRAMREGEVYT
jgi:hypothetical protein